MRISTAHAHTIYSDGKSTPEEMIESAIARGFCSIGFSDHGVQNFDPNYCMSQFDEDGYIKTIGALRNKDCGIPIYLACERDLFSSSDRRHYDYMIGSVHYLDIDGKKIAVDGGFDDLKACVRDHFAGDGLMMARHYFELLANYIVDYKPQIIGHFDLVQKNNAQGLLFDDSDPRYTDMAMDALCVLIKTDALLEINTGAIARKRLSWPYPQLRFLKRWHELGGRVTITSDCHDASLIDCGYDMAFAVAREAGFKEHYLLDPKGEALFVSDSID